MYTCLVPFLIFFLMRSRASLPGTLARTDYYADALKWLDLIRMHHSNYRMVTHNRGRQPYCNFWEKAIRQVHRHDQKTVKDMLCRNFIGENTFPSSGDVGTPEQIKNQTFLNIPQHKSLFPRPKDYEELYESLKIIHKEIIEGMFGPVVLITESSVVRIYGNKVRWHVPSFLVDKNEGKKRQIRNFAKEWTNDNPDQKSINDFTSDCDARMSAASIADVGTFCLEHKASAKLDLTNAFRYLRVAPRCVAGQFYLLLGFWWNGVRCYYGIADESAVMGRKRTPNAFCDHPNTMVSYLEVLNPHLWRTNRKGHKTLPELDLQRQEGKRIFFPKRRRIKYHTDGPLKGTPVKPSRPWNDLAGRHYEQFIRWVASPLTMILLDDSITGDNGQGIIEGNKVLDKYIKIVSEEAGFVLNEAKTIRTPRWEHVYHQYRRLPGMGDRPHPKIALYQVKNCRNLHQTDDQIGS